MKAISVSIIVPIYNVSNYIERCIKSIMAQKYPYIECLLINDCTLDDSIEKAKKLITAYKGPIQFKIINHNKNRGLSCSRNTGTKAAQGSYIYYLDSDDTISECCIESLIKLAIKYPGVEMIQGNGKTLPESWIEVDKLDITDKNFPEYINDNQWVQKNFLADRKIPIYLWNKLLNRDFILNHHLFNKEGMVWEDMFWIFKTTKYLQSIAFSLDVTHFYYLNNPNSISHSKSSFLKMFDAYYILIKDCYANIDLSSSQYQRKFILDVLKERAKTIFFNEIPSDYIEKYISLTKEVRCLGFKYGFYSDVYKFNNILLILYISYTKWSKKTANNLYNFLRNIYRHIFK